MMLKESFTEEQISLAKKYPIDFLRQQFEVIKKDLYKIRASESRRDGRQPAEVSFNLYKNALLYKQYMEYSIKNKG